MLCSLTFVSSLGSASWPWDQIRVAFLEYSCHQMAIVLGLLVAVLLDVVVMKMVLMWLLLLIYIHAAAHGLGRCISLGFWAFLASSCCRSCWARAGFVFSTLMPDHVTVVDIVITVHSLTSRLHDWVLYRLTRHVQHAKPSLLSWKTNNTEYRHVLYVGHCPVHVT